MNNKIYLILDDCEVEHQFTDCEKALLYFRDYYETCRDDYGYDVNELAKIRLVKCVDII